MGRVLLVVLGVVLVAAVVWEILPRRVKEQIQYGAATGPVRVARADVSAAPRLPLPSPRP